VPPEWLRFTDQLEFVRSSKDEKIDEYYARLPVHHVEYGHNTLFPPPHFELKHAPGRQWDYSGSRKNVWTWGVTSKYLKVRVPTGAEPPSLKGWTVKYPLANQAMTRMNLEASGMAAKEFALTQMRTLGGQRFGLLLPAPGSATFEVTLPADPELSFYAGVLKPPVDTGLESDGAVLHVEVLKDGRLVRERSCSMLDVGKRDHIRLHLAQFAGEKVQIRFRTDPGETSHLDYVFLSEPMVHTPSWSPKRLVLLFADTLRPDHLGAYGYERKTSPAIDALAAEGTLYEEIRSISPWTLPAARAALTGRQPENWRDAKRLQTILAENGWHTAAFVSNAFLSPEFAMGDEWGLYRYRFLSKAPDTVDSALAEIARNPRSDAAILVHFMEPHLPYQEKEPYRYMWAPEEDPPGLEEGVSLIEINAVKKLTRKKQMRYGNYLKDRYDQNIRMMDDQIGRLLEGLPRDATVVVYSDHGEEFWEHGGIEHGHALWEEVVRVPLIIRSPNLPVGRVSRPGSLLDLTPTLLGALGIETDIAFDGQDLHGGEPAAPVAIGRVLRGAESWAVVDGHKKWVTRYGEHQSFDLAVDPGEANTTAQAHSATPTPEALALGKAVGRPVVPVLHVIGPQSDKKVFGLPRGRVSLTLPGGFDRAWVTGSLPAQEPIIEGDSVVLGPANDPFINIAQEFFAVPKGDSLEGLTLEVQAGKKTWRTTWDGGEAPLVFAGVGTARFEVRWDALPLPPDEVVPGTHPDRVEELRALGYTGD